MNHGARRLWRLVFKLGVDPFLASSFSTQLEEKEGVFIGEKMAHLSCAST